MMSRSLVRRRIHGHLGWAMTGAVLITITACGQNRPATVDGWPTVPAADRPPQSFLTLAVTEPVLERSLPRCVADVTTAVASKNVLVEADLGYGNGKPCGLPKPGGYAIKFLLLRGTSFTTVATLPEPSGLFFTLGW
jgi:hypothetical protein